MILEFSHVENPILRQLYDTYSFNVIPRIGGLVANDSESYQYLVESIRRFPTQVTLLKLATVADHSFWYAAISSIAATLNEVLTLISPLMRKVKFLRSVVRLLLCPFFFSTILLLIIHNTRLHYHYNHSETLISSKNLSYLHICCLGRSSTHGERGWIRVCFVHKHVIRSCRHPHRL